MFIFDFTYGAVAQLGRFVGRVLNWSGVVASPAADPFIVTGTWEVPAAVGTWEVPLTTGTWENL